MWRIPFEIRELQKAMTKQVQHINIKWNFKLHPVEYTQTYSILTFPHVLPHPKKNTKKKHNVCFPFLLRSQGTVEYSCGTRCSPSNPAS